MYEINKEKENNKSTLKVKSIDPNRTWLFQPAEDKPRDYQPKQERAEPQKELINIHQRRQCHMTGHKWPMVLPVPLG